ncbi:MAG: hypothetical protein J2P45_22520, partial [Candidatus Dormibacteraeota bacterium]|nr:hypothetical protein [Candidatus Dormibacteraeota bacterium]
GHRHLPAQASRTVVSQTGGGAPGYTFSPDGRWWWDGERWRPVQVTPAPPGRRGVPRWLIPTIVAVALVVVATLAIAGAVIANRIAHLPPASAPPGHYLAGASEARIEQTAKAQGLRCGSDMSFGIGAPQGRTCQRASATGMMSVHTVTDTRHVLAVNSDVMADEAAAVGFLKSIIDATMPGDDAAKADEWLRAHVDQSGTSSTVVNGVGLQLVVSGGSRMLMITPAPVSAG